MRRIVFILMIALLPIRGWLGEAMATDMAAMNLIAPQAINTPSTGQKHHESSMPDCDMHKNMDASQSEEVQTQSTCNSCQACHATGLVNSIPVIPSIASAISRTTRAHRAVGQRQYRVGSKTTHSVILQPKLRLYFAG